MVGHVAEGLPATPTILHGKRWIETLDLQLALRLESVGSGLPIEKLNRIRKK